MRIGDLDALSEEIRAAQASLETDDGKMWKINRPYHKGLAWAHRLVIDAPTINPDSLRPKGRWAVKRRHSVSQNPYMDDNYFVCVTCSECGVCIQSDNRSFGYAEARTTNFCPSCGADMREDKT